MRKTFTLISFIVITATTIFLPGTKANAEECPTYNFQSLFNGDYYPGTKWDNRSGLRDITWSAQVPVIFDESVVRPFTPEELLWLEAAFQSWDDALETVKFSEVASSSDPEIVIGFVALSSAPNQLDAFSYWDGWWNDNWRNKATIKISVGQFSWFKDKNKFIHAVQHEVGNVLGLGDIFPSTEFTSTLEDRWQPPFGNIPLSDFDTGMVRQLYGESTCSSTFLKIAPKASAMDKTLFICSKGKEIKVIFGVKPKCPRGSKRR